MNKRLPHALILTILASALILLCKPIFQPGYIYHSDVTEGLSVDNLHERYIYTYSNDLGEALAEKARVPIFYLVFGVFKVLQIVGLGDSDYVKVKIIAMIFSSAIAFYLTAKSLLRKNFPEPQKFYPILITVAIGTLYYVINYWFVNRITHFGLFFTTVTVPITFYFLHSFLFSDRNTIRTLITLILLLGIFSATPHSVLFIALIFAVLTITFVTSPKLTKREKLQKLPWLGVFVTAYLLINSYWILPYLITQSKPDAVVSESIVNTLGRYGNITSSVRLTGYWLTTPQAYFPPILPAAQKVISYLPLLITVATVFLYRKKHNVWLPLTLLLAAGVFLSTTSEITNKFYFWLMFYSPFKEFGWLFREYDKFGLVLAFTYSLSLPLFILKIYNRKVLLGISTFFTVALLSANMYFMGTSIKNRYTPTQIPNDFKEVNKLLERDAEEFNTVWYPGVPQPYWASNEEVRFTFSNLVSSKPSIVTRSEIINYLAYLFKEENFYAINLGKALDLLGVKYLVVRSDEDIFIENRLNFSMDVQKSFERVLKTPLLTVYKNHEFNGLTKAANSNLVTAEGLNTLRYLDQLDFQPESHLITYIDESDTLEDLPKKYFAQDLNPVDININRFRGKFIFPGYYTNKKEDGNPGYWKFGSLEDKNHAEVGYLFDSLGIPRYQFDYSNRIAIARNGWQRVTNQVFPDKKIGLSFNNHPNIISESQRLKYYSVPTDFRYYWNILRSDKFTLNNVTGLEVEFKSDIDSSLIPHYKITYYSQDSEILKTVPLYGNERGEISSILKSPLGATQADFSIWTLSGSAQPVTFSLETPKLTDVSNNVKPIEMEFEISTGCTKTCVLYARVLKSYQGGEIAFDINGSMLSTQTQSSEELTEEERFQWIKVGQLDDLPDETKIRLINTKGLNAINALVFLTPSEEHSLNTNVPTVTVMENTESVKIKTTQVNPTKYEIIIPNSINSPTIITFAKPFSTSWNFNGSKAKTLETNGYINGWYFNNLNAGTYVIEHEPQKYFKTGALISIGAAVTLIGLLGILSLNRDPRGKSY